MNPNQPLIALQIEEYAIVPNPLTEFGWMVFQWQDVSLSWVERKLIQRSFGGDDSAEAFSDFFAREKISFQVTPGCS